MNQPINSQELAVFADRTSETEGVANDEAQRVQSLIFVLLHHTSIVFTKNRIIITSVRTPNTSNPGWLHFIIAARQPCPTTCYFSANCAV